jgi:hypothetical protein
MFFSSMAMFSVGEFALLIAQESQKFQVGIDLMSISAAIVFITAVLMSLTLNYSNKLYHPTNDNMPYNFKKKLDKYSGYIRTISEQLDLDNKYSQNLKNNVLSAIFGMLILLLTVFGWRKLVSVMTEYNASSSIIILAYAAALSVIGISLLYSLLKLRKTSIAFREIFHNATNHKNLAQSKSIVTRAIIAFGVLGIALMFPFVMFMFNLNVRFMIIPFAFIGIFVWELYKLSHDSNDNYNPEPYMSHKKFETCASAKHGWKI